MVIAIVARPFASADTARPPPPENVAISALDRICSTVKRTMMVVAVPMIE